MEIAKGARTTRVADAIRAAYVLDPPGWTRLEPQSVSGDPAPGLEARVHDPLWLLCRQWQLGEFHGEDAGSAVAVEVASTTSRMSAWQPGDWNAPVAGTPVLAWSESQLMDPAVERESTPPGGPGLRQRAEAGAQLLSALADAGLGGVHGALLTECPLDAVTTVSSDTAETRMLGVVGGRIPDGEKAARTLEPGLTAHPAQLPAWLSGVANPAMALTVAREWFDWYRGEVAPLPNPSTDSWIDERLEYRFTVAIPGAVEQVVLHAPAFTGGRVDWYAFDHEPHALRLVPPAGSVAAQLQQRQQTLHATPLRFVGMPAARYWQFEDGEVNLAVLEAQPHDLARLLLVEFAMIYGNDWLNVPLDVPFGSFTTVDSVRIWTTFGEIQTVNEANDAGRSGHFNMFGISLDLRGLLVPPMAMGVQEGPPIEEVLYLRDELANMAWAVERIVQSPTGDPRSRSDEPRPEPPSSDMDPQAELRYLLGTDVPDNWIPVVPVATGPRTHVLRKGAMVKKGVAVEPLGVLLRPGESLTIQDEELHREGVRVRRVPRLARRVDGSYARWIARQVTVGRGEGASGLAFDSALPRGRPTA